MLHLTKLAVGVRDIGHLRELQAARIQTDPPLRHRTRNFPRRREEVIDGGSIYWVINGSMLARQRVVDIIDDHWNDGTACAAIVLDAMLVPLVGRPTKPFQGWRYLRADDAPEDMQSLDDLTMGIDNLPAHMQRALRELCLL